jgi:hypothetical protein
MSQIWAIFGGGRKSGFLEPKRKKLKLSDEMEPFGHTSITLSKKLNINNY